MNEETCSACKFWRDNDDAWAGKGDCRRYPPTLGHDGAYRDLVFPRTLGGNWCGEFKHV